MSCYDSQYKDEKFNLEDPSSWEYQIVQQYVSDKSLSNTQVKDTFNTIKKQLKDRSKSYITAVNKDFVRDGQDGDGYINQDPISI